MSFAIVATFYRELAANIASTLSNIDSTVARGAAVRDCWWKARTRPTAPMRTSRSICVNRSRIEFGTCRARGIFISSL